MEKQSVHITTGYRELLADPETGPVNPNYLEALKISDSVECSEILSRLAGDYYRSDANTHPCLYLTPAGAVSGFYIQGHEKHTNKTSSLFIGILGDRNDFVSKTPCWKSLGVVYVQDMDNPEARNNVRNILGLKPFDDDALFLLPNQSGGYSIREKRESVDRNVPIQKRIGAILLRKCGISKKLHSLSYIIPIGRFRTISGEDAAFKLEQQARFKIRIGLYDESAELILYRQGALLPGRTPAGGINADKKSENVKDAHSVVESVRQFVAKNMSVPVTNISLNSRLSQQGKYFVTIVEYAHEDGGTGLVIVRSSRIGSGKPQGEYLHTI